jgi:spore coat polysaccharide biosynthesis protein SpsF (cytidylyltransferase family)
MEIGLIVQARLGSTRLSNKIARHLSGSFSLLDYLLNNLSRTGYPLIVAFPDNEAHRKFSETVQTKGVHFHFGSEADVLQRFIGAADQYGLAAFARICGDNPFLNNDLLFDLIKAWKSELDYATYFNSADIPAPKTHFGLFAEMVNVSALKKVNLATTENHFHEHVTPYFYEHSQQFRIKKLAMPEPLFSGVPLRLTIDTEEDLSHVKQVIDQVKDPQEWKKIISYCQQHGLLEQMERIINANVK